MISIAKEVRQAEQRERERRELLGFYSAALQLSAKHALDTPGRDAFVTELRRLCEEINRDSSLEALGLSLSGFELCLMEYSASLEKSLGEGFAGNAREIRGMFAFLKEAAGTLESSNERIGTEVKEFTHELEEAMDCQDITTIRQHLSTHVQRMKEWGEALRAESSVQLIVLEKKLRTYEERLREVESTVSIDALTGVGNRREAERRLDEWISRATPFSLVVADLNKFKAINDQYGHRCGDCVLRKMAERLKSCVRARDRVCRWGGDEFIVLLDLEASVAERRSVELAEQLCGIASFEFDGQALQIEISAAIGWAPFKPGDTAASLFQRADLEMYEAKKRMANADPSRALIYAF